MYSPNFRPLLLTARDVINAAYMMTCELCSEKLTYFSFVENICYELCKIFVDIKHSECLDRLLG